MNMRDHMAKVRALNDRFRTTGRGGRTVITDGVQALGAQAVAEIIAKVRAFTDFAHADDPYLCEGLDDLGYNVDDSDAQIIALEAGPEPAVMVLRDALEAGDVFGSVFCAPATPKNRALVRLTVNASLTADHLDHVLAVCARIRNEVGLSGWASTRRRKGRAALSAAAV